MLCNKRIADKMLFSRFVCGLGGIFWSLHLLGFMSFLNNQPLPPSFLYLALSLIYCIHKWATPEWSSSSSWFQFVSWPVGCRCFTVSLYFFFFIANLYYYPCELHVKSGVRFPNYILTVVLQCLSDRVNWVN